MKKKTKEKLCKYIFFLIIAVLGVLTSYFLDFYDNTNNENTINQVNNNISTDTNISTTKVESKLQIHYIDVGQADAILIKQGDHLMLIDAGKNDTEDSVINYLKDQGVTKFEYIVGTHVHEDHIGGMDKVIENFEVNNILFPKQISTTRTFENFVKAVKSKNMKLNAPSAGESFKFGDAIFAVLAPNSSEYEESNDYSIVIKLEYKNKSFLFMGDAEKFSEKEILESNYNIKSDVLKLGHHGSYSSTTLEFLDKVDPDVAIISCGKDNSYKHPSKDTMLRLKTKNIPVYRTDESGTVVLNCDGENISFNVEEGSYNYGK